MDKKTFLILLYLTSLLPISYTIGQSYLPNRGWMGIGLLNMVILLLLFMIFGTSQTTANTKKKKLGLVLLALLIGAMLFSGLIDGLLIKGSLRLHTMLNSSSIEAPTVSKTAELVIPEQKDLQMTDTTTLSGKVILESDEEILPTSKPTDETALKPQPVTTAPETVKPVVQEEISTTAKDATVIVNGSYGSVIPYLVKTYNLKDTDKAYPKFTRVSVKNSLYSSFATAYSKGMIGTAINPGTKVSCDTYLVLKGIAAGWKVSYTGKPFAAYRAEAESRGAVNGCNAGSFVTTKTL